MKNVVSFCLYGIKNTYILGMKENIRLGKKYFKDWEIRIYYNDTVPEEKINNFIEMGAKCILCKNIGKNKLNWEGMFWRWLPMDDETVDFWISRDADSRLSEREYKIVEQWTNSGKTLHCIRDHKCHFNPIMGGLYGINNKLFHKKYKFNKVNNIISDLFKYYKERPYNVDQIFLNDKLWNLLKNDVMAHISNNGRRIYPSDIEIPSVSNFIGKQYRLSELPIDKKKGCYWKTYSDPKVYWSNSSTDIKPDVLFNDEGDFYIHRAENGYPQNWDNIHILDGITSIPKSVEKKPVENKGCYWKETDQPTVYWSNSSTDIKPDVSFNSVNEYYMHRVENGFPKNWDNIRIIDVITSIPKSVEKKPVENKGCYWKETDQPTVYWSNSSTDIKPNIEFKDQDHFMSHRMENGFPQNWNNIQIFNDNNIYNKENDKNPSLAEYFDQIYIIHLNVLTDRKKNIIDQIEKFGLKNITIIDAINKNVIDLKELKNQELLAYQENNYCKTNIINSKGDKCWCNGAGHEDVIKYPGRVACAFSHGLAYKDMIINDYKRCLILEDDVEFSSNANNLFKQIGEFIPTNWELIYFSNNRRYRGDNAKKYNEYFTRINIGMSGATCYAITNSTAKSLFENLLPIRAAADGYIGVIINKYFLIKNVFVYHHNLTKYERNVGPDAFVSSNDNEQISLDEDSKEIKDLNKDLYRVINYYYKSNYKKKKKFFKKF
jgi:GR25 family glycosyltransferase involved in LPS biosynthesis